MINRIRVHSAGNGAGGIGTVQLIRPCVSSLHHQPEEL